jgi:hypothetical protein
MNVTSAAAVLIAAASLGSGPQSRSDIVLAAWRHFPKRFGLPGYENIHPHSARVDSKLVSTGKLQRDGYIVRVATCEYEVTAKGFEAARRGGIR